MTREIRPFVDIIADLQATVAADQRKTDQLEGNVEYGRKYVQKLCDELESRDRQIARLTEASAQALADAEHWKQAHHERLAKYDELTLALAKKWGDEKQTKFLVKLGHLEPEQPRCYRSKMNDLIYRDGPRGAEMWQESKQRWMPSCFYSVKEIGWEDLVEVSNPEA